MAKFLSEDGLRYFYNQIKSKFAPASHNHSAGNITSGTLPIARGGTGQTTAAGVRNALGLGNTTGAVPVANGGTGANTVAAAVKALLGSSAIGSSTKPLYYDGAALKACADSIGGGGIVAQLLEQNGYVKFANGLILQWGLETSASEVVTYPIPVSRVLCLLLTTKAITFRYSPWPTEITAKSFRGMSDCEPAYWFLVAKQQWGYNNTNNNHFAFLLPYTAVPLVFAMGVGKGISLRDGYGRNADNITLNGFTAVSSPTDAYPIGWLSLGF